MNLSLLCIFNFKSETVFKYARPVSIVRISLTIVPNKTGIDPDINT